MNDASSGLSDEIMDAFNGLSTTSILSKMPSVTPDYDFIIVKPPVFRTSWHQLIVIGDGFDLECGLASSFSNFVKARTVDFEKADHGQIAEDVLFTKTIWDVSLSSMGDANWCDIEGSIADWIAPKNREGKSSKSKFEKKPA